MAKGIQSVEPNIADLVNGWLKSYGLPYKLEQESLNAEIDKALMEYFTKTEGVEPTDLMRNSSCKTNNSTITQS